MFFPRRVDIRFIINRLTGYLASEPLVPAQVIILVVATVMLMTLIPIASGGTERRAVEVDGRTVAVVDDARAVERALAVLDLAPGAQYFRRVRLRRAAAGEGPAVDESVLLDVLARSLGATARGTVLIVNGRPEMVVADRESAALLLERLKALYAVRPGSRVDIADRVALRDAPVRPADIVPLDRALRLVLQGGRETRSYRVRAGDTLWTIAGRTGMRVPNLQELNPGLSPRNLAIGEVLKLSRTVPLINVSTVYTQTQRQELPCPVVSKKDDRLPLGLTRVLQAGRAGLAEVTEQVICRNGQVVGRQELTRKVLQAPREQVVAVGTWQLLASRSGSGGRLGWPVVGAVTSPFGARWGGFHPGIDIAAGYGTPVDAAAPGRVVRAGWYGGYGNCVDIDHGDGVVTRYGHLSRIAVEEGEQVIKGQLVGYVGSTGFATGPHLHFEVRINGNPVNPESFL